MTFLAPFALIGTLLLIIPIVVHLFKPRKMRQTPFSSLRWLKQTHQRLSRRIQWHQWLLFLMRAGCILLLVLALAKPLIGGRDGTAPTDRFIIIDTSRSMGYMAPGQPTPLERAVALADKLAQTARPGDRAAVIVAGASPKLLAPLNGDASVTVATLMATKPGLADVQLSSTLPLIRALLSPTKERDVELIFLTDNLTNRWKESDIRTFTHDAPQPMRVQIIEAGSGSAYNAWIASARLFEFGPGDDRRIRVEVGCVGEPQPARSVRLTGIAGVADDSQDVTLKAGEVARVEFRIPVGVKLRDQVAQVRLEPADALASDDLFFLNLDTPIALRVLLVEPEPAGSDGRSVGLYVRAGIEALATSTNQALAMTARTSAAVATGDLQKADVILLAGVPELAEATLESLETRVRGGAGLALFLGSQIKPDFYNGKLHRAYQPAEGVLPCSLKQAGKGFQKDGNPGTLTNIQWTHSLLAPLRDPLFGDLTQCRFRTYGYLVGPLGKNDAILARFDDDVPAVIEHPLGAGRVLVFNTSANDEWSDLPRRKSFVPLLDRTLSYLSAGGVRRTFSVGEAVNLPLPALQAGAAVTVRTPGGISLTPRLTGGRGQTLLHIDEVSAAGVYHVEGAGTNCSFVVNGSRSDSSLTMMDSKALTAWWSPALVEFLSAETAGQRLDQRASVWPLWPVFVVFAGLLLLAETIYVHRLCPRANPKPADAVVPQRGVIRPVTAKSIE